jgi:aldehyde:ferredoxin oxidoreductase
MGLAKSYIGGCSLAARLAYELIDSTVDPFGPKNPLIFMTGPLTGTLAPCSGRHGVCAKSPLTGIWGEATTGGFWGATLKHSGYDGIIVTGKSDRPVYVEIENDDVKIKDAAHLWGKGTYETQEILLKDTGRSHRVTCIGPAGENRVRFAAIINDNGRAAARTGLGAVMGSKKLKAISVKGDLKAQLAKEEKFKDYALSLQAEVPESGATFAIKEYGTAVSTEVGMNYGDAPAKYFTENEFPAAQMTGMVLKQKFNVESRSCFACPIGCGRHLTLNGIEIDGPEYETIAALGAMNCVYDLKDIVKAGHVCNDYGMDTISAGVVISFAIYLFEKGLLKPQQAGTELRWGDGEQLSDLLKMTAERKGLGHILAEGVSRMAEKLGVNKELAATVKKLEIPMHDPRAFYSTAISYATSPRGACHLRSDYFEVDMGSFEDKDLGIIPGGPMDRFTLLKKGKMIAKHQNLMEVLNASVICSFLCSTVPSFKSKQLSLLLTYATGWNISVATVNEIGERSFNIKRVINNGLGVSRKDDRLPQIVLEPLKSGGSASKTPKGEFEQALREYYQARKWNWDTGRPKPELLSRLGINHEPS